MKSLQKSGAILQVCLALLVTATVLAGFRGAALKTVGLQLRLVQLQRRLEGLERQAVELATAEERLYRDLALLRSLNLEFPPSSEVLWDFLEELAFEAGLSIPSFIDLEPLDDGNCSLEMALQGSFVGICDFLAEISRGTLIISLTELDLSVLSRDPLLVEARCVFLTSLLSEIAGP